MNVWPFVYVTRCACHTTCTTVHVQPRRAEGRLALPPHSRTAFREHMSILWPTASAVYYPWLYNKAENLMPADIAYSAAFTHVIAKSRDTLLVGRWEIVDVRMS